MAVLGRKSPIPWLKPAVLTGSLVPIAAILERAWRDDLGPDPIAQALNQLGLIALVFLIAALGCTPLKAMLAWTWPMRIRRMLGLLAFFYALLHVITYTVLDQGLDWHAIVDDMAPALAVLHFIWRVKLDVREPVAYGLVLAALLSVRLVDYLHDRKAILMREI